MKKGMLIIPMAFVAFILLSSTVFSEVEYDYSYNPTTGKIQYNLNPGWNLIPLGISMSTDSESENTCKDSIKATYVYSPVQKQYLGAYYPRVYETIEVPEGAQQILQNEKNSNFFHAMDYLGGVWIYTTEFCEFRTSLQPKDAYSTVQEIINTITIKKGWNFIATPAFMIGHNFKELFQSCDVLAANAWDSYNQKWTSPSSSQLGVYIKNDETPIYEAGIGKVILFKVGDDCHLTLGDGGISPPPLPP